MTLLISSLFIYNSVGNINDDTIDDLELILDIMRNIQLSSDLDENNVDS